MAVVYLNYLPPSMRVAVFMSAALGKPPPRPVIYRGTCLLYYAAPQQIVISMANWPVWPMQTVKQSTDFFLSLYFVTAV